MGIRVKVAIGYVIPIGDVELYVPPKGHMPSLEEVVPYLSDVYLRALQKDKLTLENVIHGWKPYGGILSVGQLSGVAEDYDEGGIHPDGPMILLNKDHYRRDDDLDYAASDTMDTCHKWLRGGIFPASSVYRDLETHEIAVDLDSPDTLYLTQLPWPVIHVLVYNKIDPEVRFKVHAYFRRWWS